MGPQFHDNLLSILVLVIPNGCLDAYEVKVNIDIFQYQEKVKLSNLSFPEIFWIFQWFIIVSFIPIKYF